MLEVPLVRLLRIRSNLGIDSAAADCATAGVIVEGVTKLPLVLAKLDGVEGEGAEAILGNSSTRPLC